MEIVAIIPARGGSKRHSTKEYKTVVWEAVDSMDNRACEEKQIYW